MNDIINKNIHYKGKEPYYIYIHTTPEHMRYVGLSKNPKQRWNNGEGYKKNEEFYKDIQKFGWNNIKHEIIAESYYGWVARKIEKCIISVFKKRGLAYNKNNEEKSGYVSQRKIPLKRVAQYDKNGKPMAQILSGSNKSKQLLALRRALNDVSTSTTQSDWSDDYSGFGPDKYQYKYNSSASWIRARINSSNGFQSWPWLYVNMKFRPHNGDYRTHTVGGAVDYPIMRIEEMYYLKAEAALHTSGVPAAAKALEDIVKTRNSAYTCTATTADAFLDEYVFQKGIEFWGEGINYFDAKRLEVGIHRAYKGSNCERYQHCIDMDGAYVGWTPGWNQAELNANPAIFHYNNPYTNPTTYYVFKSNDELRPYYGTEITE